MNVVAIPTIGKSPLLWPLLDDLARDPAVDEVWVMDNGLPDDQRERLIDLTRADRRIVRANTKGQSIYHQWNGAIRNAQHYGVEHLAILNDDLRIPPHLVDSMARMMRTYPDVGIVCPDYQRELDAELDAVCLRDVHGTYSNHGIAGFCFMVRVATCPLIDPDLEIWFGDDDLVAKIEQQGQRACIIDGLPIEHEESTTLNQCEWVPAAILRDKERWAARRG